MKRALVNPDRRINCQPCPAQVGCDRKAMFREAKDPKPWVDFYRCSGCLKCKAACPAGAVDEIAQPCDGRGRMGW